MTSRQSLATNRPSTTLTPAEQALWATWEERVRRYRAGEKDAIPEQVVGLGTLRVFGRSGDAPLAFPRVRTFGDLELLPPDVQFALTLTNRTVQAHADSGAGRMIYATAPAQGDIVPEPETVTVIDPTKHADVLIVAAISGGAR
jgi:hypothetical protein